MNHQDICVSIASKSHDEGHRFSLQQLVLGLLFTMKRKNHLCHPIQGDFQSEMG